MPKDPNCLMCERCKKERCSLFHNNICSKCFDEFRCTECYKNISIKNRKICRTCYTNKTKPYRINPVCSLDNGCGGIDIFRIVPINQSKPLRLHCVAHYEYELPKIDCVRKFHAIHNWKDVWGGCDGWADEKWSDRFSGKLNRGILSGDGNGIISFVEDSRGNIYYIHGVWG